MSDMAAVGVGLGLWPPDILLWPCSHLAAGHLRPRGPACQAHVPQALAEVPSSPCRHGRPFAPLRSMHPFSGLTSHFPKVF